MTSWLWGTCPGTCAHFKTLLWQVGWNEVTRLVWTPRTTLCPPHETSFTRKMKWKCVSSSSAKGKWGHRYHRKEEWIWNNNKYYFISIMKSCWSTSTWLLPFCQISASASLFSKCSAIARLILILSQLLSCCSHGGFIFVLRCLHMWYFKWCVTVCVVIFLRALMGLLRKCNLANSRVCVLIIANKITWLQIKKTKMQ